MTLKTRLSIVVSALFVAFVGTLSVWSFTSFDRHLKSIVTEQQRALTASLADKIDDQILSAQKMLARRGSELVVPFTSGAAARRALDERVGLLSMFNNGLAVFSPEGTFIAASTGASSPHGGGDLAASVRAVAKTQRGTVSSLYTLSERQDHPAVMVLAPVVDAAGRVVAVFAGSIDLAEDDIFVDDIVGHSIGSKGFLYLCDRTGRVFCISEPLTELSRLGGDALKLVQRALNGGETSGETTSENGTRFVSTACAVPAAQWVAVANYPVREAYAPVVQERYRFSAAIIAATILILLAVRFVTHRLVGPLTSFTRHVVSSGVDGRPRSFTEAGCCSEIQTLAGAFNEMIAALDRKQQELRHSEESVRQSYTLLQKVFGSLNEAVFIVATGTRVITECNAMAEKMFGYRRDELVGATTEILHDSAENCARFGEAMIAGHRESGFFETTFVMRRKDGTVFESEHFVTPILEETGAVSSHLCVVRDISERCKAEKQIRQLNTDLARHAEELELTNRELESFNYTVTHDLRAPLNNLTLLSQLYQESFTACSKQRCYEYVQAIEHEVARMAHLIALLLNFSHMNHVDMKRDRVDLSLMAAELLQRLRREDPLRNVAVRVAEGVVVEGDPGLLEVVMTNLIGNAWKYSSGKERAVIEFGIVEEGGERVFYVRDDGIGFSTEEADKLFVPFTRLHSLEAFPGFGIGLATVDRIVHRHGGRVWAEGREGKGATFYFTVR